MAICLERSADLHVVQLMPLPLTISCSSKIQTGFTFLVPAHPDSPGQRAVKRVCVCVCHCSGKRQNLKKNARKGFLFPVVFNEEDNVPKFASTTHTRLTDLSQELPG